MRHPLSFGTSMAPLILPTDKPFIKKGRSYKVNDVVAFRREEKVIVHRVIYIPDEANYITKGDNNLKSDGILNKNEILGKVEKVLRNGRMIALSHVYLSQSLTYLTELGLLNKRLKKSDIDYVLLKGLPIQLIYSGKIPKRLYFDADILVRLHDFPQIGKIFKQLGYEAIEPTLLHKPVNKYSQISFVKKVKPYAVIIDVHFAPAIGFTKALRFNKLIPSIAVYGRELFSNAKAVKVGNNRFPILIKEDLLLYLLLHLFHHNFQGIHRMELIANVIGQDKPDMDIVLNRARRYGYEYIIYPSVLVFNKFFGGLSLPKEARIPLFKILNKLVQVFFGLFFGNGKGFHYF